MRRFESDLPYCFCRSVAKWPNAAGSNPASPEGASRRFESDRAYYFSRRMAYIDQVEDRLHDQYGEANVEREVYLPETYRFADFRVECGDVYLLIEVENDTDDVVERGYAQAQMYAHHGDRYLPVIYYKPDEENGPELEIVGRDVALVPFDPNA